MAHQWERFVFPTPVAGGTFSGVLEIDEMGSDFPGKLLGYDRLAFVETHQLKPGRYTIYFASVVKTEPLVFSFTQETKVIEIKPLETAGTLKVKELCAGMGGIGVSSAFLGHPVASALDVNALACDFLRRNFDFPVIHGSVLDDRALCSLQTSGDSFPCVITAGFPCQPYSQQGDRRGLSDSRAAVLFGVLRAKYLFQAVAGVLECVTGAGDNRELQKFLMDFAEKMSWTLHTTVLELAHQWPCRRLRWWGVMCPKGINLQLRPWPRTSGRNTVGHVLFEWPVWPLSEERLLQFSEEENSYFFDELYGNDPRRLELTSVCATFLHSYGHSLSACACGCRPRFSEDRLINFGVRGFGIRSPVSGFDRFLHCHEVAFLQTLPATLDFLPGRDELVLLGQVAAPLQALWIFSHLYPALELHTSLACQATPEQWLDRYVQHLYAARHDRWIWHDSRMDRHVSLKDAEAPLKDCSFLRVGVAQVQDLLRAETIYQAWGTRHMLYDGDRRLKNEAILQSRGHHGPYALVSAPKKHPLPQPQGWITLVLVHDQIDYHSFVPAGSFLFEALYGHNLSALHIWQDRDGMLVFADTRIWESQKLINRDQAPPTPWTQQGAGAQLSDSLPCRDGLSALAVCLFAERFLDHDLLPQSQRPQISCLVVEDNAMHWVYGPGFAACTHKGRKHFVLILEDSHWTLAEFVFGISAVLVRHYDGLGFRPRPAVLPVLCSFWQGKGFRHGTIHSCCDIPQRMSDSCGTIALGHLVIASRTFPAWIADVWESVHPYLVRKSLLLGSRSPVGFGPSSNSPLVLELAGILSQHGVPEELARERADLGIQKIGAQSISKALRSNKPWPMLKELASRPNISLQWVRASELQAQIDKRAAQKFRVQPSQKRHQAPPRGNKDQPKPLTVDPSKLTLLKDAFEAAGQSVLQVSFGDIKQDAAGIAIATIADLGPFLKQGKQISAGALGILCTSVIADELINGLSFENLCYPAIYAGTGEPILLHGTLVQLGKVPILRKLGSSLDIDQIKTQTLRITLFRDAWPHDWSTFVSQPFRSLLKETPGLNLCRDEACGDQCARYHSAVDEALDNLILDLWGRGWHAPDGRFVPAQEAFHWSALIRVPASAHMSLQRLSGPNGLFLEPRSSSGKEVDGSFQVVWLNDFSVEDASYLCKTTSKAIALTRLNRKFGIRFHTDDYEAGFKVLRPSDPFLPVVISKVWKLFPLPFGTQRSGLQKAVTEIPWAAKVLQQVSSSADGSSWEVGAAVDPPCNVLRIGGQDVMITLVRNTSRAPIKPSIVASSNTRDHLKQGHAPAGTSKLDPWLSAGDPWSMYKGPMPPSTASSSGAQDKVNQLESRVNTKIGEVSAKLREAISAQPMDTDDEWKQQADKRFGILETNIHEIQAQNAKLENWITQVAEGSKQTHHQVTQLTEQLTVQQGEVSSLRQETRDHATATSTQLREIRSDVQSEMQRGMAQITALLEKKQRMEWLGHPGPARRSKQAPGHGLSRTLRFWISLQLVLSQLVSTHAAENVLGAPPVLAHLSCEVSDAASLLGSSVPRWLWASPCRSCAMTDVLTSPRRLDFPSEVCVPGSVHHSIWWHLNSVFRMFPFHSGCHRWGEARHPGPEGNTSFSISFSNPSGVAGKELHLLDLPPGILTFAETHLSAVSQPKALRTIRSHAAHLDRRLRVLPGASVPLRPHSLTAGVWAGMLHLADTGCHLLTLPWPDGEPQLGRVITSKFFVGNSAVVGCTVYGWPTSPSWPRAKLMTASMLNQVTENMILNSHGMRFVSGDFNGTDLDFPILDVWASHGWIELQALFQLRTGTPICPTCKGKTRPDRIYLSPELASLFLDFEPRDVFADHSTLIGSFDVPFDSLSGWRWPMAGKLPWSEISLDSWHSDRSVSVPSLSLSVDSTQFMVSFGQAYESSLVGHGGPHLSSAVPPGFCGRAQFLKPRAFQSSPPTLRPSRQGEERPGAGFLTRRLCQWFKQLRRIQSLLHNLRAAKLSPDAVEYRLLTWASIRNSSGFAGGFPTWWTFRPIRLQGVVAQLPVILPTCAQLEDIYLDFRSNYRSFESWHLQNRRQVLSQVYTESLGKAFKEVVGKPSLCIDHFEHRSSATILAVEADTFLVKLDSPMECSASSTFTLDDVPATVVHVSEDRYRVDSDLLLCPGQVLQCRTFLTHTDEMLAAVRRFWLERWHRHVDVPESQWARIFQFVQAHLVPLPFTAPNLTVDSWDVVNLRYQAHAARGSDSFDHLDLRRMPTQFKMALVNLFNEIEGGQPWPQQLLLGLGHCLHKHSLAATIAEFRPIIVYSVLYRSWASWRSSSLLSTLGSHAGPRMKGFLAKCEAGDIWFLAQALVESSLSDGTCLLGCSSDIEKAFENIPRTPLRQLALALGVPSSIIDAWFRFLNQHTRRFSMHGLVGEPTNTSSGLPEGCALSVFGMSILDFCWDRYQQIYTPQVLSMSYVDNFSLFATSLQNLLRGYASMSSFMDLWSLSLDSRKTYMWALDSQSRTALRQLGFQVKLCSLELGGAVSYSRRSSSSLQVSRLQALDSSWLALKRLCAPTYLKEQIIRQAFWPSGFHACCITPLPARFVGRQRTKAVRALRHGTAGANPCVRLTLLTSSPQTDPGFYQLWRSLMDFRRLMRKTPALVDLWRQFHVCSSSSGLSGPFSQLREQCSLISWIVTDPPLLVDHDGMTLHLLNIPSALLYDLMLDGWHQALAATLLQRKDFAGLQGLQWPVPWKSPSYTKVQCAQLAALREGAFMTGSQQGKFDLFRGDRCKYCGFLDTLAHRALECPYYGSVRSGHPADGLCSSWVWTTPS